MSALNHPLAAPAMSALSKWLADGQRANLVRSLAELKATVQIDAQHEETERTRIEACARVAIEQIRANLEFKKALIAKLW
jgi:hypothetical protein